MQTKTYTNETLTSHLPQLITRQEVIKKLGISSSTFYRMRNNDPAFPAPIHLTPSTVRYCTYQVREWLELKGTTSASND